MEKLTQEVTQRSFAGYPILLVSSNIRLQLRRFVEHVLSNLVVLSHNEIAPDTSIETLGVIKLD